MPPQNTQPRKRRAPQSRRREETAVLTVDHVGAQGDGVAFHNGRRVYVAHTAAGDVVRAVVVPGSADGDRARVEELLTAGPGRQTPPCRHAAVCGGCSVQHLDQPTYTAWKLGLLKDALARAGFPDAAVEPMAEAKAGERRRARFALLRRGRHVFAGYNQRMSKLLVDLEECPVLAPALPALLAPLRALMLNVLGEGETCDVAATLLDGGIDLLLVGPARLDLDARMRLAEFAETADLARLSWKADDDAAAEPVAARRTVRVDFAGTVGIPPAGGFLQATETGQAALQDVVLTATAGAPRVVDLFCGSGAFALPLAARAKQSGGGGRVAAYDGDKAAINALTLSGNAAQLPLSAHVRDLFRDSLSALELREFDAVVFDPPRAGATAQAVELARSGVPVVVAVSCNPASFARDARTLAGGGYVLTRIRPVDQFLWSGHIELAAVFERPA
jgi:23S rRNA (uracil1939-C5)-methyltransferase